MTGFSEGINAADNDVPLHISRNRIIIELAPERAVFARVEAFRVRNKSI